jgi:hypothetical protein
MTTATPAGWFPDPQSRGDYRYWDGAAWTAWISRGGAVEQDPLVAAATPTARPRVTTAQVRAAFGGVLVMLGVVLPGFTFRFNSASWRTVEHGEFPVWAVALVLGAAIVVFAYRQRYATVRLLALGALVTLGIALWLYDGRFSGQGFDIWPSLIDIVWGDTRVTFGVYAVVAGAVLALVAGRAPAGEK